MIKRIYIGDRAFLHRYGSSMEEHQIREIYKISLDNGFGICSGDLRTAKIANSVKGSRFIYHSRFLIRVFDRLHGYEISESYIQSKISDFYGNKRYRYSVNYEQIYNDIYILNNYSPEIVTIGGDWLDILVSIERWDLISSILSFFDNDKSRIKFVLTFNPTIKLLDYIDGFDGVIVPLNILNMKDDYNNTIKTIARNKKLMALHILAGGLLPVSESLDYVFNHLNVDGAIIGTGNKLHISEILSNCENLGVFDERNTYEKM